MARGEARHLEPFLVRDALRTAMGGWRFPLHFIDFETAQPALPFHVGHRPYQPILFQFSHHVASSDGAVQHATEYLQTEGDGAPSIEVARRLQDALGGDHGTVLHWYPHRENHSHERPRRNRGEGADGPGRALAFLEELGLEKDSHLRLLI